MDHFDQPQQMASSDGELLNGEGSSWGPQAHVYGVRTKVLACM